MNKEKEVVVALSHLPWDFPCDYIKQTSLELSKRAKVIIFSPKDFPTLKNILIDRKKRKEWFSLFKEKRIVYFPSLAILPLRRFKVIEKLNIGMSRSILNVDGVLFFVNLLMGKKS